MERAEIHPERSGSEGERRARHDNWPAPVPLMGISAPLTPPAASDSQGRDTGMVPMAAQKTGRNPAPAEWKLDLVASLIDSYSLEALDDFLESCRRFAAERAVNVAVLGRFKAGKTTFLKDLLGRPLLPLGVVPVSSVVTEIDYGEPQRAVIEFQDGRREEVPVSGLGEFVDGSRNPVDHRGVRRACASGCRRWSAGAASVL